MRILVGTVVTVAACYSAAPPSGVPCDPTTLACPTGQTCVVEGGTHVCRRPDEVGSGSNVDAPAVAVDAAIDALTIDAPADDVDGDGVKNDLDNCPQRANASQFDEDRDTLGDACDPCPPFADNADLDGDGVGDACDPRPDQAGDTLVVFAGFADGAVPAGWEASGPWQGDNDRIRVELADNEEAYLVAPGTVDGTGTTTAVFTVNGIAGGVRGIGPASPTTITTDNGLVCALFLATTTQTRMFGLVNLATDGPIQSELWGWNNTTFTLTLTNRNTEHDCTGTAGSQTRERSGPFIDAPSQSRTAFVTKSISTRLDYFMYVDSP